MTTKTETREITILNGPNHNTKFETEAPDFSILNSTGVPKLNRLPEDADVRYTYPMFMDQYFIWGKYAYYIGQRMLTGGPFEFPHEELGA